MLKDLVSVIIPTHNRAQMAVEAVESALAQTYSNTEVIVVDDGSTDETPRRLEHFGRRIQFIRQRNQGASAARNTGVCRAGGDFVAFLDSDDLWHPRKLETQVRYLWEHPEVGLLGCRLRPTQMTTTGGNPDPPFQGGAAIQVSLEELAVQARFATSGTIVRRSCLDAAGVFDTNLGSAEDRDLFIRIAAKDPVHVQEMVLGYYRDDHHENLSGQPRATERNTQLMLEKVFREVPTLRGRALLRRRALSQAAYEVALLYAEAGEYANALGRICRSLFLRPCSERAGFDPRLKGIVVNLTRLIRGTSVVTAAKGVHAQPQPNGMDSMVTPG